MSAEVDAILQIAALLVVIGGGYAGVYAYRARPVIKAVGSFVAAIQTIRAAQADGAISPDEERQAGRAAFALFDDVVSCAAIAKR